MTFNPGVIEPRNMSMRQRRNHIFRSFKLPAFLQVELRASDTELKCQLNRALINMIKGKEEIDFAKLEELKHGIEMERLVVRRG